MPIIQDSSKHEHNSSKQEHNPSEQEQTGFVSHYILFKASTAEGVRYLSTVTAISTKYLLV
jgi:hypothetical protein